MNAESLIVRPDGSAAFTDFGAAQVAAPDGDMRTDRAQLLVTTALAADTDRAVAAAIEVLGEDGIVEVLPFLQPAAFERDTRIALHDQHLDLKALRESIAERTHSEVPPLEPLQRVTWQSLLKLAVIGFLAYTLISAFANIGIDTIIEQFQNAEWSWLLVALVLSPLSQVPQAFSSMGATLQEIRFWPVLMLQYGVQFISLAVPSSAARLALEVRFWERAGVPSAGAVSIGAIDSFSTFVIQILLIVLILASDAVSLNLASSPSGSADESSGFNWAAVVIAILLVAVALGIAYAFPKTREKLHHFMDTVREKWADAKEAMAVLRRPKKVLLLLGGNLVAQVMLAIILGLCLRAFGQSASLAALILVNTFVSLFAGFMPVPGGRGRRGGGLHRRPDRARHPGGGGDLDRARLPARHVLPAAALGRVRDALDEAAVAPVRGHTMRGLTILAVVFICYALIASKLDRWWITAPMVFVAAGALLGPAGVEILPVALDKEAALTITELTLALLLFADASGVRLRAVEGDRTMPERLLFIGLPLTVIAGALLAQWMFADMTWATALLVATILAPTDAALGLAVVTDRAVPVRIRRALNVESGLNDGIMTPFVTLFIAVVASEEGLSAHDWGIEALTQIGLAICAAIIVGLVGGKALLFASDKGWTSEVSQKLAVLALALLSYGGAVAIGGNGFVAAFVAGILFGAATNGKLDGSVEFTETLGLFTSFFVWSVFGAIFVGPILTHDVSATAIAYALLSLTVVRMLPVAIALIGKHLRVSTLAFMGWFGPRGLASVIFTLIALDELKQSGPLDTLVVVATWTILLSVVLHGISATPLAARYGASIEKLGAGTPELAPAKEPSIRLRDLAGRHRPHKGGTTSPGG